MTWLLAVIFRPVGALIFFGFALVVSRLLWPLIPDGPVKAVLYDRAILKRYPWTTFVVFATVFYGTVVAVYLLVT